MILEVAEFELQPGRLDEFLAVLPGGIAILKRAEGFISVDVFRGEEKPNSVLLVLRWETLEDHTVGFREGPLFPQWREVISPFFATQPAVAHWHPAGLSG